jgi:2-polyprenyl-6-methoxyphenol hydroxylase-like FAD-dependent oxidoreductase
MSTPRTVRVAIIGSGPAGWTAAIRGTRIRVFDATQQIATADPWHSLTHPAPPLLLEWVALHTEPAP